MNAQSPSVASATRSICSRSLDRAWYGLGLVLIREGRLDEAIVALRRNIKLQPMSPYGYYQLGMTYHHLGRADEAWKVYEELKGFEPRYAATLKRDIEITAPQAVPGQQQTSEDREETAVPQQQGAEPLPRSKHATH